MQLMTFETLGEAIEEQTRQWPLARDNFNALGQTQRRIVNAGDLTVALQYNPARIKSTGARIDSQSIAARRCFLCADNRPTEQMAVENPEGWDFLVNPYPIFPLHFTIASRTHQPQGAIPPEMAITAEQCPGLAAFYNGARAGASAPDHLHYQAVAASELPLLKLVETRHPASRTGIFTSLELGLDMPFGFYSAVISPDADGMRDLARITSVRGRDRLIGAADRDLVNAYFWIERAGAPLRCIVIPRGAHRPSCYGTDTGQHLVSPGAVDMAGVIILPRIEDFDTITAEEIVSIYEETGIAPDLL